MKHVELFEFFAEGHDQDLSHVLLHITEPSTRNEFDKGYFFALVEIEGSKSEQVERVQELIEEIEAAYYDADIDEANGKDAFEFVLESMNRHSGDVLNNTSIVHSIVGVIRENHLSFSYHGMPHALLFYKRGGAMEQVDLIQEQTSAEEKQLFPSVLEGEMNDGDMFLVATPRISNYFSYDRLKKIFASRGLRQGVAHIQKVLHDLKDDASFGGMAIRVIPPEETPRTGKKPRSREGSAESLNKLLESERTTAETLSPPIFGNLTKKMSQRSHNPDTKRSSARDEKKIKTQKAETNYRPRSGQAQSPLPEVVLIHLGRAVVYSARWIFGVLKTIAILIARLVVIILILITNKNNGRGQVLGSIHRKWIDAKETVVSLPLLSKILFAGAVIFALVFVASIGYIRVKENIEAEKEQYTFTIDAIEDKVAAADAAIIYGDDAKAFALTKEAELLLETINNEDDKETHDRLRERIDGTLAELRKMQRVESKLFADLTESNAGITGLALIENKIIAYAKEQPAYFSINTNTRSIEEKTHDSALRLVANTTPKEHDTIVFLYGASGVAEYQKDNGAILQKDISFPTDTPAILDGFVYNVRLYTLDAAGEQIYKHSKTQTGYDKGVPWITKKTSSLADAQSIAIDSDIYVLTYSGNILKFEAGVEKPFMLSGVDPSLDRPTDIWTYADVDRVYILEPTNKRIVVVDKNGALVTQYTSEQWEHPEDMVVDLENNLIYILDANRVYQFSL